MLGNYDERFHRSKSTSPAPSASTPVGCCTIQGPTPDHCGAWQVGTLDSPKGDIAPAMPAVWRYQIYPRKEK